jgi:hypothetical protein
MKGTTKNKEEMLQSSQKYRGKFQSTQNKKLMRNIMGRVPQKLVHVSHSSFSILSDDRFKASSKTIP